MNNAVILHLGHSDFGHYLDRYQEWSRTTKQWSNFNWWHNFVGFPRLRAITEPFVRRSTLLDNAGDVVDVQKT